MRPHLPVRLNYPVMFHTLTSGGGTALTQNDNCLKNTKKAEIEYPGSMWHNMDLQQPRAIVYNLPFYHVGNKDSARLCFWETMEFNNLLHTMSLLCR